MPAVMMVITFFANVTVAPTTAGMPGAAFLQTLLNWLGGVGLVGAFASILGGGMTWGVSHRMGHTGGESRGRNLVLGGLIGAAIIGLAPTLVNVLYVTAAK